MQNIDVVFFDAGGGHRSAATALDLVIRQQRRPWNVRLVNLQELLDEIDIARKFTGLRVQDIYNTMLRKGWTLGSPQLVPLMHGLIRLFHRRQVEILKRHWIRSQPDLAVSVIPNFNRALFESLSMALPGVPMVTILTDLADYPPHFWLEPQDQWVICGTERAVEQAKAMGLDPSKILRASGMILHPKFYETTAVNRTSERARLGLEEDWPTGIVLFGGYGSGVMEKILDRLDRSGLKLQLILICGHNDKLRNRLRAHKGRIPVWVEGFTQEIPYFMRLADFFIGKPGPGSISEALAMGLPVIVECNAWTLPQERYNARWIMEQGVGLVVHKFGDIEPAVRTLLEPSHFARFRSRVASVQNRAIFEIPEFLERILETRR